MQHNPKDPLLKAGPEYQRALFQMFAKSANGFSVDDAVNAAANIIINALRQAHPSREEAARRFDEIFGRMKQLLMDHYTSAGRVKGVFPYDQIIQPEHFIDRDGFRKH